jgi:hypothetical protein
MGAITGTLAGKSGMTGGKYKIITVTAPIASASDTITLTAAAHGGVQSIVGILGAVITGGMDADFQTIQVSYSGLVITVVSKQADGAAADEFTGTTVEIALLVSVDPS